MNENKRVRLVVERCINDDVFLIYECLVRNVFTGQWRITDRRVVAYIRKDSLQMLFGEDAEKLIETTDGDVFSVIGQLNIGNHLGNTIHGTHD